eukprot:6999096-Ditylum_brightwellii.AAC.1
METAALFTFLEKPENKTHTAYASLQHRKPQKIAPEDSTGFHVGFLCEPPFCRWKLGRRMPSSPLNNGGHSGVTATPLSVQKRLNLD